MYTFSKEPVAEFYGRKFYSISNSEGEIVAYSERLFEVPNSVRFLGADTCLIFEKAVIRGGTFWGGDFLGGDFLGGTFRGGTFLGGDFRGGDFLGGTFRGGTFLGGTFLGGTFRGGTFLGGTFRGGDFLGGTFRGGTYEVPMLQIQGTRHFLYAYFNEENSVELGIGCERHPIEWWQENYKKTGMKKGYSSDQIEEYAQYIELFAKRYHK